MTARKQLGQRADTARNELIRIGGTINAVADIFSVDAATVRRAITKHRIPCIVNEDGHELYSIRDCAPFLVDLSQAVDIEAVLKSTSLKKLPPELTKNYWDAYNARKKALEDDKRLWRTEAVMEVFLDAFRVIRQSINQFVDTISDRTEVTEAQRVLIAEMCDGLLASTREKLIQHFELYSPNNEERYQSGDDVVPAREDVDDFE
jgi:hypothetical protein